MEKLSSVVSRVANETYGNSRQIMPEQPWWNNLEASFHKFPDDFYLDARTQLMVDATAYVDIALRTAVASLMSVTALPVGLNPFRLKEQYEDRLFYQALADRHDPTVFFKKPERVPKVTASKPGLFAFKPEDGVCEQLSFTSEFEPINPRMKERFKKFSVNNVAQAQYWRHDDGPRPTICVVHGFMADPYWVNSSFLALPWFYKQGYDILLYTLPFHGRRQEPFSPFSGAGYFSGGVSHINETVAQSIYDLRCFLQHLQQEKGVSKIGVTGISLGGYTTSLLASVESSIEFAVPNVPVVSLIDLIFQWFPAGNLIKSMLRVCGLSVSEARHSMAVHCPLTYEPAIDHKRLMIVGGAGDRMAPPKHSRLLWDHWGRCRMHWFPGNHVIHLDKGKYLREMRSFMQELDFLPERL